MDAKIIYDDCCDNDNFMRLDPREKLFIHVRNIENIAEEFRTRMPRLRRYTRIMRFLYIPMSILLALSSGFLIVSKGNDVLSAGIVGLLFIGMIMFLPMIRFYMKAKIAELRSYYHTMLLNSPLIIEEMLPKACTDTIPSFIMERINEALKYARMHQNDMNEIS